MQEKLIEQLSETCLKDEGFLTPLERTLIDKVRQRIGKESEASRQIASAIAETVAQRAAQSIQANLETRLLRDWSHASDMKAQGGPAPGPQPMAPRPPSPTPPSPAPSPNAVGMQNPPSGAGAPRPPSPPPSPRPSPGITFAEHCRPQTAVVERCELLPAQCVVLDEFLAPIELEGLMRYVQNSEAQYRVSEVISPGVQGSAVDFEYRRSMVLFEIGAPGRAFVERAQAYLPRVLEKLGRAPLQVARVEAQITASNDGDFFRWHCDDGQDDIATREITFVYFLHREPKPFRGGELRIYDSRKEGQGYVPTADYRVVVPRQNQIVFFPSALAHEITPVECSSKAFVDSRFTVNGWFHR